MIQKPMLETIIKTVLFILTELKDLILKNKK